MPPFVAIRRYYRHLAACLSIYIKTRWVISLALISSYFYQAYSSSYDIITYLIGFYLLQLAVAYFTPKGLDQEDEQLQLTYDHIHQDFIETELINITQPQSQQFAFKNNATLPLEEETTPDQVKPLVGSVGQFQVWVRATAMFCIGLICTQFKSLQVDVFWPILMAYFVGLVCHTFYKIVRKMQKYKYSFADFSKKVISNQNIFV